MEIIKAPRILLICCALLYGSHVIAEPTSPAAAEASHVTIAEDIELLAVKSEHTHAAAQRLISKGTAILSEVHKALESPEATYGQKQILMTILGVISDPGSIPSIVRVAEQNPDRLIQLSALRNLGRIGRTQETEDYVYQLLNNKDIEERVLQSALDYLANSAKKHDRQWAEQFSAAEYDLHTRSVALYLGAMTGSRDFKDKIIEALKNRKNSTGEMHMLMGLSELTTPDEFNTLIKTDGIRVRHESIEVARNHYFLKHGNEEQKTAAATKIIHKGPGMLKQDAIHYLIDTDNAQAMSHLWMKGDRGLVAVLQKARLKIIVDEKGSRFEKISKNTEMVQAPQPMSANDERPSVDEFYRAIFSSLKNNNKQQFKSVATMSDAEIARLIARMVQPDNDKKDIINQYKEQYKKAQKACLDSWDDIYRYGLQNNIDWAETRYVASDKQTGKYDYNRAFLITYKGYYYIISVPRLMLTEGKWKLMDRLKWQRGKLSQRAAEKWSRLAAENNDTVAEKELTILSGNTKEGRAAMLEMLSTYSDVLAQYELYKVNKANNNINEANEWLIRGAVNGYNRAQFELSELLIEKWTKTKAPELLEAYKSNLLSAADQNYIYALKKVAERYSQGFGGFEMDHAKAIAYYNKALNLDPASLPENEAKAYKFFRRDFQDRIEQLKKEQSGFEAGDPQTLTSKALEQLDYRSIDNKKQGLKLLQQAADAGYPEAQFLLGKLYAKGSEVVNKNNAEAVALWRQAAANDHVGAIEELATGYIKGQYGLSKDPEQALPLADRVADYYQKHSVNHKGNTYSARVWRVHACNMEIAIARQNDPTYVVPRVKTGRCEGL